MRLDLNEDPAILEIAHRLETRPEHVVGYCHRFWSWASRNLVLNLSLENGDICPDAVLRGVPIESIESALNLPGFLVHLTRVGWLKYESEGPTGPTLTVPNFDRWLSQSAKARLVATQKKRRQRCIEAVKTVPILSRKNGDICPAKTGTTVQNRRVYKKTPYSPPEGDPLFETFWSAFPRYRRTKKQKAFEAWTKAVKRAKPEVIIAATREYAESPVGRGKFVLMPTTWLNGSCWNDDRMAWQLSDSGDIRPEMTTAELAEHLGIGVEGVDDQP